MSKQRVFHVSFYTKTVTGEGLGDGDYSVGKEGMTKDNFNAMVKKIAESSLNIVGEPVILHWQEYEDAQDDDC
jgi:hypothetical protein